MYGQVLGAPALRQSQEHTPASFHCEKFCRISFSCRGLVEADIHPEWSLIVHDVVQKEKWAQLIGCFHGLHILKNALQIFFWVNAASSATACATLRAYFGHNSMLCTDLPKKLTPSHALTPDVWPSPEPRRSRLHLYHQHLRSRPPRMQLPAILGFLATQLLTASR